MTGPDFSALNGSGVEQVVGALLTIVLVVAVAALIVSGVCWAIGEATGNWQLAARSKVGVFVAVGAAAAAGSAVAYINWLVAVGEHL